MEHLNKWLRWGISNSDPEELEKVTKDMREGGSGGVDREWVERLFGDNHGGILPLLRTLYENTKYISQKSQTPSGDSKQVSVEEITSSLERIEDYIQEGTNTSSFVGNGGFEIVGAYIGDERDSAIRRNAAWVLATAVQHHPDAQKRLLEVSGLYEEVIDRLKVANESTESVRLKVLGVLSGVLRGSIVEAAERFLKHGGMDVLREDVFGREECSRLHHRALFLLPDTARQFPKLMFGPLLSLLPVLVKLCAPSNNSTPDTDIVECVHRLIKYICTAVSDTDTTKNYFYTPSSAPPPPRWGNNSPHMPKLTYLHLAPKEAWSQSLSEGLLAVEEVNGRSNGLGSEQRKCVDSVRDLMRNAQKAVRKCVRATPKLRV